MALTREWVEALLADCSESVTVTIMAYDAKLLAERWLATQWQTATTAPKDGQWLIGAYFAAQDLKAMFRVRWHAKRKLWQEEGSDVDEGRIFTHWMPVTNLEEPT